MNKRILLGILIILFTQTSCETDKSRMEDCDKIVKDFMSNLPLDNYDILYKYYPTMSKIKRYWKIENYSINNTSIESDGTVSVTGIGSGKNVMFILTKVNDKYVITHSKGLASVYDTYLYKYCKQIGCIGIINYDAELSQTCSEKENDYKELIEKIKNDIESHFKLENNNLSVNYGYISGDITMKNGSRFTLPAFDYEITYNFLDDNSNVVFSKKEVANYSPIQYGGSLTRGIYETYAGNYRRITATLNVTATDFIEQIISENARGNNCVLDSTF